MPSVLVECGFLSNGKEEGFLASDDGQDMIASGIYRAIKDYKTEIESIN
jgi:N-acetylmuramoyl-L-alanine amidase